MKLAVIADIHANVEALTAVLAHLDSQAVDEVVCLGDVIGYGASPAECVAALMERKVPTIHGNHERMLLGIGRIEVRPETRQVIDFTREQLSAEQTAWLGGLEEQAIHRSEYLLVHGSPRDRDEYCNSPPKYQAALKRMRSTFGGLELCFFGHTHFPLVASKKGVEEGIHSDRTIELKRREIYLVNPGSIGQPRDGCVKASYAIYDDDAHAVNVFRVEYDIDGARQRILDAGLSEKLAARLSAGK